MNQYFIYATKEEFLKKLKELTKSGVAPDHITTFTPYSVEEVEEILKQSPSRISFFALIGALAGTLTGFAFTIYTVLSWPAITSGKPLISLPPFIIIAFELTILLGAISSLIGFFVFSHLPDPDFIDIPGGSDNQFAILVKQ